MRAAGFANWESDFQNSQKQFQNSQKLICKALWACFLRKFCSTLQNQKYQNVKTPKLK
jgi:hypothetical protein